MSAATIRHIMGDLEDKGYIFQPHTSSGRVPKTPGYREYVDHLMKKTRLSGDEKEQINESILRIDSEIEDILKEATRILAHISRQLGVIVTPSIEQSIFQRLELIPLSSNRIIMILTIESGFVKTIKLEIESIISDEKLHFVSQILNERLNGLKISDIRRKFSDMVKDIQSEESGIVRMISARSDRLFDFGEDVDLYFMGTHHIVQQPDFSDVTAISSVVELLESQKIAVHLLKQIPAPQSTRIQIGEEIAEEGMQECSMITACYRIGKVSGVLGVIGPKRMNYSKLVSLVDFTARTITNTYGFN
jgi:heat-inducible transcriptional repressor